MTKVHAERLASLCESFNPERIEADLEQARKRARQDDESAEPWARAPGEGRTLARGGLVYVRARTPEPVKRERVLEQQQQGQQQGDPSQPSAEEAQEISGINQTLGVEVPKEPKPPQPAQSGAPQAASAPQQQQQPAEMVPSQPAAGTGVEPSAAAANSEAPIADSQDKGEDVIIVQNENADGTAKESGEGGEEADADADAEDEDGDEGTKLDQPEALATEAEALTHPLSAEAQAASKEQTDGGKGQQQEESTPAEAMQQDEPSSELTAMSTQEAAPAAIPAVPAPVEQSAAPAPGGASIETGADEDVGMKAATPSKEAENAVDVGATEAGASSDAAAAPGELAQ